MSASQNEITGHYGHPQHKLVRAGKDATIHICKDCKAQIFDHSSCYKCKRCEERCEDYKYLHGACLNAKPNSEKPYPFISNFTLKFSSEKIENLICTACCGSIKGIMYTGSHVGKKYSLHPECLELSPNLRRANRKCKSENSELELEYLERFPEMPTNRICVFCQTGDSKGWCYGLKSNGEFKFACHVRCIKKSLIKDWSRKKLPVEMADRKKYFNELYKKDLKKFTRCLTLDPFVAVGLDLLISAFVGAPIAPIISVCLALVDHAVKKR